MQANFWCNGLIIYITCCCELNYVNICMMIYLHVLYECVFTLGHCICTYVGSNPFRVIPLLGISSLCRGNILFQVQGVLERTTRLRGRL